MKLTPNQVVAYNLRRARQAKGWTQADAGTELGKLLGQWSKQTVSTAERAFTPSGRKSRDFSVNELTAFALCFGYTLEFFLTLPPESECEEIEYIASTDGDPSALVARELRSLAAQLEAKA